VVAGRDPVSSISGQRVATGWREQSVPDSAIEPL
jgi:hypothetical protein